MVRRPERLRGMPDVLPEVAHGYQAVLWRLRDCFECSGYRPIDVPVIEDMDLFLTKVGEEFIPKLYGFNYRGRTLCLRPEFTSSVCRAFIDHYQRVALPLRFHYAGPVFRHDAPGRARFRQYTQAGVELFGGDPLLADAELILLAVRALDRLGIARYRLVLGHIGVLMRLLHQFALDDFARTTILNNLENMVKADKGEAYVRARLAELHVGPALSPSSALPDSEAAIALLLRSMGLAFRHREEEQEIAERLAKRLHAPKRQDVNRALDFVLELRRCAGMPTSAFAAMRALLARYQLAPEALAPLEQLVVLVASAGIASERIVVDPGLGRGLQYYTGLVFEIHGEHDGGDSQLCGGGRYDELTRLLGGPAIPAAGFAFGVERLWLAACAEAPDRDGEALAPQAMVIPVSTDDWGYALEVAERLRALGLEAVVDIRRQGVAAALRRLGREQAALAFIAGSAEREAGTVVVRDISTHEQRTVRLSDLGAVLAVVPKRKEGAYAQ